VPIEIERKINVYIEPVRNIQCIVHIQYI
jgi:hypothetical protein